MKKLILLFAVTAGACTNADDAVVCSSMTTVAFDPSAESQLVSGDIVVHGGVTTDDHIFAVYVGGVPAVADSPDFEAFNVTLPFALLQSAVAADPTSVALDITRVGTCEPTGSMSIGTLTLKVKTATTLDVRSDVAPTDWIASTKGAPVKITVLANAEAAGLPLTITPSQGSVVGPAMPTLDADGTTSFFVVPDAMKEGMAVVDVRTGNASGSTQYPVVGPPQLNPPTTALPANGGFTVFVSNSLPPTKQAASIMGCSATATQHVQVKVGNAEIQNLGLTPLGAMNTSFTVAALSNAAGGENATVTCYDIKGQSSTATYKVP